MIARLLVASVFHPGLNPNPHIFTYIKRAAEHLLGQDYVDAGYVSEARKKIGLCDAVLLVAGSLDRQVVPLSIECRKTRKPVVFWATDDPYEIDFNLEHLDLVDHIWSNDRSSLHLYPRDRSGHLPLAADSDEHVRETLVDESDYWYDVSFVGVEFPNRRAIVQELAPLLRTLKTAIIGPNWSIDESFILRHRITNRQAAEVSNHSRVVLNLGRRLDLSNTKGVLPSTPGPRTFEAGGCGTAQVVSYELPEVEAYYRPGLEIEFASTLQEMKTKVEKLVFDSATRRKMAEAARQRTKNSHLYDNRLQEILNTLEKIT